VFKWDLSLLLFFNKRLYTRDGNDMKDPGMKFKHQCNVGRCEMTLQTFKFDVLQACAEPAAGYQCFPRFDDCDGDQNQRFRIMASITGA